MDIREILWRRGVKRPWGASILLLA